MTMNRSLPLLFGTALMALPAAAPLHAQTMAGPIVPVDGTVLDVVAEGRVTRTPDIAIVRAGIVTQDANAAAALKANAARMTAVLAAVKKLGIADRDVQTSQISLQPQYRYAEGQPPVITGYQATNQLTLKLRDVARAGAALDVLVAQGANTIEGPTLMIDAADAAMDEARTDAVRRARARADLYARAAGLRVDRILVISEGAAPTPGPVPVMMARMESDSSSKIMPGEQSVDMTVSVRFLLK
ncbi:SIMPL domain-containing protein [Sphingomonas sp. FW199]|uniref:SIMPL domain-containing protein n=1 Tax=Sphingomonas sp. FW199 TaxID=3400217 RepID=UPI003CFB3933